MYCQAAGFVVDWEGIGEDSDGTVEFADFGILKP